MAVAPSPASTAARTASFEGNSNSTRRVLGFRAESREGFLEDGPCSRPGFAQHPFPCHEILERQPPLPAPGMVDPDDNQQLIPRHRRALEKLVLHRSFDKPHFRCSARRRRRPPAPCFRPQDKSRSGDELFGTRRGGVGANSSLWSDWLGRSACPAEASVFAEGEFGGVHSRYDGPRLREKRLAGLGQLDAAAN